MPIDRIANPKSVAFTLAVGGTKTLLHVTGAEINDAPSFEKTREQQALVSTHWQGEVSGYIMFKTNKLTDVAGLAIGVIATNIIVTASAAVLAAGATAVGGEATRTMSKGILVERSGPELDPNSRKPGVMTLKFELTRELADTGDPTIGAWVAV